jgi:flagellar export protein FliJ
MKAFSFRLDQVLRWREMQVTLQESRLASATARLGEIRASLEARHRELSAAATSIATAQTGAGLAAYADFRQRTRTRIRDLESQAQTAQRAVALATTRLVEANQKRKLIANLKADARAEWSRAFDRELSAFADEAFLNRIHSASPGSRQSLKLDVNRPDTATPAVDAAGSFTQ